MAYRGLTIIFASFLLFLGHCGYSNGECADGGCNSTGLGSSELLTRQPAEDSCYNNSTSVALSCSEPGTLEGPSDNTCNDGTWEKGPTNCTVYCSPPTDVQNLELDPDLMRYEEGDEITFSCSTGYKLTPDSPKSAQCTNMGSLNSTRNPECIAFNCSAPSSMDDNLDWTDKGNETYKGDQTIQYSCAEGFKLEGSETNTCMDQDEWENEDPTCNSGNVVQVFWYFFLMTTFYSIFSFYM
ncbi:Complement receptor type 2 [Holothuria leucospilota]|uniref:Complement receptor type 2 n=1 Tax=Holothuria leucospilota TaxID=206669 RepID=A0A9Q1BNA6_HOLLE|nr:Complement receptor type 2 [Holothuria leucospilota]